MFEVVTTIVSYDSLDPFRTFCPRVVDTLRGAAPSAGALADAATAAASGCFGTRA